MKSRDLLKQELLNNLSMAMKENNEEALAQAFTEFADSVQQNVLDEFREYQQTADTNILTQRGVRQLTSKEKTFYQGVINAMKSSDVRQAFTGLPTAFPETVIDNVIADIRQSHPLLDIINFMNTAALTKIIVNKKGMQLAKWGALGSAISKELEGAIGKIDLTLCKLTAFMPISKDMLEVGPEWIDRYVRETLSEAIALALETAIVTGTGKDEPIGMDRDVSDDVSVSGGVYPKKSAKAITDLSPKTYGAILKELSKGPNDKNRVINSVILVVNPADYFEKIMPATTVRTTDGSWNRDVFPFPTTLIQSSAVTVGEAIIGIADKYFMGIGAGTSGGRIEYSDEYKFLDDERVYITKLYGNGRALDDNAFKLLNISGMEAAVLEVAVTNVVKTKEQV
ncbi:MAG: phage major capsid protein [Clostridium sp.]|nr:phage major capsid protein [Clostridium sp.]